MGKEKVSTCGTNITRSEGTGTLVGDSQGGEHIHFGQSRGISQGSSEISGETVRFRRDCAEPRMPKELDFSTDHS